MIRKGSILLVCSILSAFAAWAQGGPEVSQAGQHDVSPPLREIPPVPPKPGQRGQPWRLTHQNGPTSSQPDPVVQTSAGPLVATTPGLNFAGVGNGDYGFAPDAAPPDTNGAVGATQVVQWVNESFAVFDKATGALAPGFPKTGNTLWSGFGGGCELNNDGDPIVQYDKAAGRWIFTQFSVTTLPYLQCVAVSKTPDATGAYNRYAFSYGNVQFPDYPKLGVWPDAYYISFNIFNNGASFAGPKVCAYDRAKMLAGAAATQVCFQLSTTFGSLLPSDLDGSTPPPAGSPNFSLSFGSNKLNLWKFHVDFVTPGNSTFTGPISIPVAAFSAACGGGGACIRQLGTSQRLDSLADRLMYRLAYRNFGDHESLVVNHSVTAGSSVGVRWYELRSPNGAPTVFQQGTFAPDSAYRWMGSIAMDQAGDIALGYSVSSSAINPSIRYTGRVPTDPSGTMLTENVIKTGTGSQTGGLNRWGDYSSMSVDPVDDCTFWYTNEYLKTSGSFNWSTWIASFKFPGCGSTVPDVAITQISVPASVIVSTPTSVVVTVQNVGGAATGSSFTVSLSDSAAATITSSPQTVGILAPGASVNLTFGWTPTVTGSHTLKATATSPTGETNTANNILTAGSTVTTPPDVTITLINIPASPVVNIATNVVVSVKNVGGAAAGSSFTVSLSDPSATITASPQTVGTGLAAGASVNLTFGWTPTTTGLHTLTANASSPTGETNTANNTLMASSTVIATPPPDFSLSATPSSQTVVRGAGTTYTVNITRTGGFAGSVGFTVTGLPSGAGSTLPSTSGNSSTLSITTSATTATGTFPLTITGTGTGVPTHMTSVTLVVSAACTNGNCQN